MKLQKRPFLVELRRKRSGPKQPHSIWADVDLAAATDALRNEAGEPTVGASPAEEPNPARFLNSVRN
jgi:hypothetical protein